MGVDWRRKNSLINFFYECPECELSSHVVLEDFLEKKVQKILGIKAENLERSIRKGSIKFYQSLDIPTLQFKKDVGPIESGTVVFLSKNIEVIRGFPKIRRTLMLSPTLETHFGDEIAVEEKMNGYNVRIANIKYSNYMGESSEIVESEKIVAITRGGYICPFTTQKAQELMNLSPFFKDNPDLVLCGEMVGIDNPYVSHDYPEVGKLGFRVFDIRHKLTNDPLTVKEKRKILKKYGLPAVRLFGIFPAEKSAEKVKDIIIQIGLEDREGVVMKHPSMEIHPLKYTASQAHDREIKYAFTFPFDFGRAFFFSRVIREGFQAYEMNDSPEELHERAQRMGESIIFPMLETIQQIAQGDPAVEDSVIDVGSKEEAEAFLRHLNQLGVSAMLIGYKDGKALIRRNHQATTDKVTNYLNGGLY